MADEIVAAWKEAYNKVKGKKGPVNNNVMASFRTVMAMERTLFSALGFLAKTQVNSAEWWMVVVAMAFNFFAVVAQMVANAVTSKMGGMAVAVVAVLVATVVFAAFIMKAYACSDDGVGGDDTVTSS